MELFKLNSPRRFGSEVVEYAVYSADFVDDAAHNGLKDIPGDV